MAAAGGRPRFLKQYGALHSGTNYARHLVLSNFAEVAVLMHLLGDKHSPPAPLTRLWREAQSAADPAHELMWSATLDPSRLPRHPPDDAALAEMRRLERPVAAAVAAGQLAFLVSIKDPYAWASSLIRHLPGAPRARLDAHRLTAACRDFNRLYGAWLALANEQPAQVVRHEDLVEDPAAVVDAIGRRFALRRRSPTLVDAGGRMPQTYWDHVPLASGPAPFDRDYYRERRYLEGLRPAERALIERTIDWELIRPFGYRALAEPTMVAANGGRRMALTERTTPASRPPAADTAAPSSFADYRNRHAGATIVVCGCGTSLNDLEQPERFLTIGVNDVGRLFQPDYLVVLNPPQQFRGDRFRHVAESRAQAVFSHLSLPLAHAPLVRFRLGQRGGVELGDPTALPYTRNSPYVAVALAVHLGARRIGVIGVDFTDHHFFGQTGRHPLTRELPHIETEYRRLLETCARRGVELFNLSADSRLQALPRMSLADFTAAAAEAPATAPLPAPSAGLRIVSYSTTPVVGVPAILARSIGARTGHECRTVWSDRSYGNGICFDGDVEYRHAPGKASALLDSADAVIVHNGKVAPEHLAALHDKAVVTLAHNVMWNVDRQWVERGFPGLVVAQYAATLPEFADWTPVPNPVPLWEPAFQPGEKPAPVTVCYTPAVKHERYPVGHRLYSYGKGYRATMAVLERLAASTPVRLEVVRTRHVAHAEALAMKRRSHVVVDECVTGGYHRNSLEGLAMGAVVVNGVGTVAGMEAVLRRCVGEAPIPFVASDLDGLEAVLRSLVEQGAEALREQGERNRRWMEQHWDFAAQWPRFWQPALERALDQAGRSRRRPRPAPPAGATTASEVAAPAVLPASRAVEDLTVVIPHCGGGERLRNLRLALDRLARAGAEQTILVEIDRRPRLAELARATGCRHVFVPSNGGDFHKTRAMNVAIPMIRTSRFVWFDSDILIPPRFLHDALAEMESRQLDCLVPWTEVRYLEAADTVEVAAGRRDPAACKPLERLFSRSGGCGGAVLVRTDFVKRVGGMWEEFRGWGGEDSEFLDRARVLGRAAVTDRRDVTVYHAYHPRHRPRVANARNQQLLEETRRRRTPEALLALRPRPRFFTAPWLGTKTIACAAGAEEIGRLLAELYGPAVDLCGRAEGADAVAEPDPARTAYEAAIELASRITTEATATTTPPADAAAAAPAAAAAAEDRDAGAAADLDAMAGELTARWPWADGSLADVHLGEVLAYLPDRVHAMNELWRVLRPGGRAEASVLTTDGPGAFADPGRVSYWNRIAFHYYEEGHPLRDRSAARYGIAARFRVLRERCELTEQGPRLTVELEAVKPEPSPGREWASPQPLGEWASPSSP